MKNLPLTLLFLLCISAAGTKAQTSSCHPPTQRDSLDINNVNAMVLNGGDLWWNLVCCARYEVPYNPKDTQRGSSSLFAGALWIGGIDQGGQLHVAAATYRQNGNDYFPGPLDANGQPTASGCANFDKMWKLNKTTIDSFRARTFPVSSSSIPANILTWPANGNPYDLSVGNRDLAPFIDVNGDGIYDPTIGDYPDILGDQSVWWVYNDMGNVHKETGGKPLDIEVQEQAFAFKTNDCLNDATFYQYKLIYKGTSELDSTFIGIWTDPDLGCYTDDFIGCDSTRNIGICYNASAYDGGNPSACVLNYGNQPPIIAIDLLGGTGFPKGEDFEMTRFGYYNNDFSSPEGNPQSPEDYYRYLSGTWRDSTLWTYGGDGHGGTSRAKYVFTGEPDLPLPAWSECSDNGVSGDRRMIMSSGEHRLKPGDVRVFYMGVAWVRPPVGTYPCPSFALLDDAVDCMKTDFTNNILPLASLGIPAINQPIESVSVFPNPATGTITMSFSDNRPKQVLLYNVLGMEVKKYLNVQGNSLTIQRNNLPNGIYFYKVSNSMNEIQTGKLILQ